MTCVVFGVLGKEDRIHVLLIVVKMSIPAPVFHSVSGRHVVGKVKKERALVVGVLLALGAGAAAFMLSSQGTEEQAPTIPLRDVVVASTIIDARSTIDATQLTTMPVMVDDTNASAFTDPQEVTDKIAAIPIYENQMITPNMLAQATGVGAVNILDTDETVEFDSPYLRAVSLTVPPERAVGGHPGLVLAPPIRGKV